MTSEETSARAEQSYTPLEMAANIVSAYVSKNAIPPGDLPALIKDIHSNLSKLASGVPAEVAEPPKEPAVPIKKSVTPDFIICLENGKKFKSLKRHLSTAYGMTPQEYRKKWSLPPDYPMVAPNYSTARSALAKEAGLGAKGRRKPAKAPKKSTRKVA